MSAHVLNVVELHEHAFLEVSTVSRIDMNAL